MLYVLHDRARASCMLPEDVLKVFLWWEGEYDFKHYQQKWCILLSTHTACSRSQFCLSGLSGGVALQPHLYEPSVSTNNSAPSYVFKTSSSLHQILYLAWNLERGGEDNWGQSRNHVWATPPEQGRVTWGVQPFRDCSHSLSANSD